MYPNDNRYPDNMPPLDNMNQPPMYGNNQMRAQSMDLNNRPPYYDTPYYEKPPIIQQPIYDYINQPPPMMPMNQGIDPRYSNWRQSSQNRGPVMHPFYQRPSINESYMHSKPSMTNMGYPDNYPISSDHLGIRPQQMNVLQRISYLIKPQLPQLKKIMSKISSSSTKKKQPSRRQRSRERQTERRRSRSHEKSKKSSDGEWVCSKCSFLNFDWRQKCKKCNQSKPFIPLNKNNFTPGPQDWKCSKCGNLNYARRFECNRCKMSRVTGR